mmetsp:Transcript_47245/g.126217  ORF Transcript_47245/g.126217 Transcript_47245/m.126217 type:complete len:85 (+) Transcript_47245:1251-1505(+)
MGSWKLAPEPRPSAKPAGAVGAAKFGTMRPSTVPRDGVASAEAGAAVDGVEGLLSAFEPACQLVHDGECSTLCSRSSMGTPGRK